jgi:hypothetical protein
MLRGGGGGVIELSEAATEALPVVSTPDIRTPDESPFDPADLPPHPLGELMPTRWESLRGWLVELGTLALGAALGSAAMLGLLNYGAWLFR